MSHDLSGVDNPSPFQQYDVVRIVLVLRAAEAYDGWKLNQRPPRVGATVMSSNAPDQAGERSGWGIFMPKN